MLSGPGVTAPPPYVDDGGARSVDGAAEVVIAVDWSITEEAELSAAESGFVGFLRAAARTGRSQAGLNQGNEE